MPATFEPGLDIMPESQRKLWPEPDAVPSDFVLYGGTSLAVQLRATPICDRRTVPPSTPS